MTTYEIYFIHCNPLVSLSLVGLPPPRVGDSSSVDREQWRKKTQEWSAQLTIPVTIPVSSSSIAL